MHICEAEAALLSSCPHLAPKSAADDFDEVVRDIDGDGSCPACAAGIPAAASAEKSKLLAAAGRGPKPGAPSKGRATKESRERQFAKNVDLYLKDAEANKAAWGQLRAKRLAEFAKANENRHIVTNTTEEWTVTISVQSYCQGSLLFTVRARALTRSNKRS